MREPTGVKTAPETMGGLKGSEHVRAGGADGATVHVLKRESAPPQSEKDLQVRPQVRFFLEGLKGSLRVSLRKSLRLDGEPIAASRAVSRGLQASARCASRKRARRGAGHVRGHVRWIVRSCPSADPTRHYHHHHQTSTTHQHHHHHHRHSAPGLQQPLERDLDGGLGSI